MHSVTVPAEFGLILKVKGIKGQFGAARLSRAPPLRFFVGLWSRDPPPNWLTRITGNAGISWSIFSWAAQETSCLVSDACLWVFLDLTSHRVNLHIFIYWKDRYGYINYFKKCFVSSLSGLVFYRYYKTLKHSFFSAKSLFRGYGETFQIQSVTIMRSYIVSKKYSVLYLYFTFCYYSRYFLLRKTHGGTFLRFLDMIGCKGSYLF